MRRRRSVCVTFLHESYNPRTEFHRMGFTHVYLPMLLEHSESQICQLGNPESGQREHALAPQPLAPARKLWRKSKFVMEALISFAVTSRLSLSALIGSFSILIFDLLSLLFLAFQSRFRHDLLRVLLRDPRETLRPPSRPAFLSQEILRKMLVCLKQEPIRPAKKKQ